MPDPHHAYLPLAITVDLDAHPKATLAFQGGAAFGGPCRVSTQVQVRSERHRFLEDPPSAALTRGNRQQCRTSRFLL